MRRIAAGEFKQHCLRLLDEVGASGEPIVITKRGRAVAQLTPVGHERLRDRARRDVEQQLARRHERPGRDPG